MMKKYIVLSLLFFCFYLDSYAFEAQIKTDKDNYNINENIKFTLIVDLDDSKNIELESVKWLENFDIISTSSSQKSTYSEKNINWKIEMISKQLLYVDYIMKANKDGTFSLWPVVLNDWLERKETKSINLQIDWNRKNEIQNKYKKQNYDKEKDDIDDWVWLLFIIVFWLLIWSLVYYKKEFIFSQFDKLKKSYNTVNVSEDIKKEENISFLNEIEELPNIDDSKFIDKIILYTKNKLIRKYNLKWNFNSLDELIIELDENLSDSELLKEVIDLINRFKYSNLLVSKQNILDIVKKI